MASSGDRSQIIWTWSLISLPGCPAGFEHVPWPTPLNSPSPPHLPPQKWLFFSSWCCLRKREGGYCQGNWGLEWNVIEKLWLCLLFSGLHSACQPERDEVAFTAAVMAYEVSCEKGPFSRWWRSYVCSIQTKNSLFSITFHTETHKLFRADWLQY